MNGINSKISGNSSEANSGDAKKMQSLMLEDVKPVHKKFHLNIKKEPASGFDFFQPDG